MKVPRCEVRYALDGEARRGMACTPGLVIADSRDELYLVTAGHGLKRSLRAREAVDGDDVYVDGVLVGQVSGAMSYVFENGYLIDIGIATIDFIPRSMQCPPWSSLEDYVRIDDLRKNQTRYEFFGQHNSEVLALFDSVFTKLPISAFGVTYRGPLLYSTLKNGSLDRGDSGAVAKTLEGRAVGIHVVGSTPDDATNAWAIPIETVLEFVSNGTGRKCSIARTPYEPE
jgi:hypothetical protein